MKNTLLKISLLLWVVLLTTQFAAAQAPKFGDNPTEFVSKLKDFMNANKRPDMEESVKVFEKTMSLNLISPDEMVRIMKMSNTMAGLNLAAHPYFKLYLNSVTAAENDKDSTLFLQWHNFAEKTMATAERGKTKPVLQFLEFSADFLEHRAFKTGESGSVTWKIKGGKFTFDFENNAPMVRCVNTSVIALRKQDSVIISQSSGAFYPYEQIWKGEKGKITWERHGLDSTVYALLGKYQVEVTKPIFKCAEAKLFYPLYFANKAIDGKFEDNVTPDKSSQTQFPQFESFDKKLRISKIGEGIQYDGGFQLRGLAVYGYGNDQEPARVTVFNKKRQRVYNGSGQLFVIKHEKSIVAEGVESKMFMDGDSLFHPAVGFRVEIPEQIIHLTRGVKGNERNPFYSSFYNMNLDVEKVTWYLEKDSLDIGSRVGVIKGVEQTVSFESNKRFDANEYSKIQNISSKNPISTLMTLDKEKGNTGFVTDNDFAKALSDKFDYSSIQTLLAEMVAKGFINYYFDKHIIQVREKLTHYALASQGKKDYDYINIQSVSGGANAQLNLKTKETLIHEVDKLEFSRKQRVATIPDKREIHLLKNRDMRFSGKLYAGFALFEGQKMNFEYDKFQINMDSVKHLDFYLPTASETKDEKTGAPKAEPMTSTIEYVSGVLLIDAPNNKSGKEDLPTFPSLQTKEPSFIFYDYKQTQNGVYKRDSFSFKVDPFPFNGLDKYKASDLRFKGEMRPALIFPPFKETVLVRDHDKSFGFVHKTPAAGYPTYVNKGKYTGEVDLSNKGFLGKGTVEYLTADIVSEDIVFRPKQMTCTAKQFFMEEDRGSAVKVPQAKGEVVKVNWMPFRDSMYVESKAKDFELYKAAGYTHKGVFILTPSGLKGKGEFEWAGGKLSSKLITYGPFQASADTANLQIKALNGKDVAFDSRNLDGELDFDKQTGHFKANSDTTTTTLPFDKYKTSMNEFTWDMTAQTVKFKSDESKFGTFLSIDAEQDSLFFKGKTAFYDMKTNQMKIGGVPYIKSADAFIYEEKGDVEILPGGKMKQFLNARIVADTINRYHVINRATVDILGKKLYKATGYYEYNIPGYTQEIFFNNIVGQRRGGGTLYTKNVRTSAGGDIKETDKFRMDVKTLFKGTIVLDASKRNLRFEGFAKLDADKLPNNQWFTIYSEVDKNDPTMIVKNTKNYDGDPLVTGFYLSKETGDLYPRILEPAYARVDRAIIDCEGAIKYESKTDKWTFGDSLKVVNPNIFKGAKMIFDNRTGDVSAEGNLNICSGLDYMKLKVAGKLKSEFSEAIDTSTGSASYKVTGEFMTGANMIIPSVLTDIITAEIRTVAFDAQSPVYMSQQPFYTPALAEFITTEKEKVDALNLLKGNQLVIPKNDNKYSFVIGRHNVVWNAEYNSFVSMDDKLPIVSIGGEPLHKIIQTYIEYKMPGSEDDRFYIYMKISPDLWYFFGYQAGALYVTSSSPKFNDALLGLKKKDLAQKMPDGETYEIIPSNAATADQFVSRVKSGRKKN
jgi:hypothetical protein